MSTKFQTLCRKPRTIRLSSFEDMSDYVTELKTPLSNKPQKVWKHFSSVHFWKCGKFCESNVISLESVFELGYIITHIFKTTQPNRTRFSA